MVTQRKTKARAVQEPVTLSSHFKILPLCFAGLQTSTDARFYALSAKFPEAFSNEGKTLVVQFTVKHEQSIDCGGGYVKVSK